GEAASNVSFLRIFYAILALGLALETAMHPEVLVRMATDRVLNALVGQCRVGDIISAGIVLQHGLKIDVVVKAVGTAEMAERHHCGAGLLCKTSGCCDGGGWCTEKGREYALFAPIILIRRIPDNAIGF